MWLKECLISVLQELLISVGVSLWALNCCHRQVGVRRQKRWLAGFFASIDDMTNILMASVSETQMCPAALCDLIDAAMRKQLPSDDAKKCVARLAGQGSASGVLGSAPTEDAESGNQKPKESFWGLASPSFHPSPSCFSVHFPPLYLHRGQH